MTTLTVRTATSADQAALAVLAELDSAAAPTGEVLVAESGGDLLAAMSLADGHVVADPFRRTAEAVEVLRMRAAQLTPRARRPRLRVLALPARLVAG